MIELISVNKRIGHKQDSIFELKDINLKLDSGDRFLLLGENGSGKSTLMKLICGLNFVDSGEILLDGKNIRKVPRKFYKNIGFFQSAKTSLDLSLNIKSNFEFTGYMYKCKKSELKNSLEYFISIFPILENLLNKYYRELSLGERTICELVDSLIHKPAYIFLDEPTIGIDTKNKQLIANFISSYSQEKKLENIIISTHDFEFAKNLNCNKAGIIKDGCFSFLTDDISRAIDYAKSD